ncbi:hypothetical protein HK097_002312 [Rhizophlyctis rosea]|uniref:rhamnogalacturonan endolyase n=1 Tax=Rhizophlyctis rosea TaxID=64517 RepID=A0AAD5SKU5_9FUNG|nr:hypothetical protein HK097_002312 [Rhizophlyctis rosea]
MVVLRTALGLLAATSSAFAAFQLTTSSSQYVVDTNAGLVFAVSRTGGNLVSIKYNNIEVQDSSKPSAINSGFGTSTVTAQQIGTDYIKVTVKSSSLPVTHHWIAKRNEANIYMATANTAEVDPGEFRMLFRLKPSALPNGYTANGVQVSQIAGGTAIEGSDVYNVGGTTRSKFYSSERFIDDQVHGVSGSGVGAYMVLPGTAYETSSGGPFMRDINNQQGSQQEVYVYWNSGHLRTEPWRFGLHGPYALVFTTGSKPSANLDTSFFEQLSIDGYVPKSGRGQVTGTTSGVPSNFETVVHWYNTAAQYWTKSSGGKYTSPYMKPGTYTVKMYKNEYPVYTGSVTVTKGSTTTHNIASTEPTRSVIWKIGEFDGQPFELKNGDKFLRMHPSDSRMSSWGGTYTVGTSSARDFPMAIFKSIGNAAVINFNLNTVPSNAILRIGTTLSFGGGRPSVTINSYSPAAPGAPTNLDSRGVTRGGYRGLGEEYTFSIPAGTLKVGANTITIGVASGSSGTTFLSPNFIVDAVQLEGSGGTTGGGVTTTTIRPPATTTTSRAATTTVRTSTTVRTTTGGSSGSGAPLYGQCGGQGWTGATSKYWPAVFS